MLQVQAPAQAPTSSVQAPAPSVQAPALLVQAPLEAPTNSSPTNEVPQQASTQSSDSSVAPRRNAGRESAVFWNVETIGMYILYICN